MPLTPMPLIDSTPLFRIMRVARSNPLLRLDFSSLPTLGSARTASRQPLTRSDRPSSHWLVLRYPYRLPPGSSWAVTSSKLVFSAETIAGRGGLGGGGADATLGASFLPQPVAARRMSAVGKTNRN